MQVYNHTIIVIQLLYVLLHTTVLLLVTTITTILPNHRHQNTHTKDKTTTPTPHTLPHIPAIDATPMQGPLPASTARYVPKHTKK